MTYNVKKPFILLLHSKKDYPSPKFALFRPVSFTPPPLRKPRSRDSPVVRYCKNNSQLKGRFEPLRIAQTQTNPSAARNTRDFPRLVTVCASVCFGKTETRGAPPSVRLFFPETGSALHFAPPAVRLVRLGSAETGRVLPKNITEGK